MVAALNAIKDGEGRIREKLSYVSGKMEKGTRSSYSEISTSHMEMGSSYRGTSLIRNSSPPKEHRRALGIVLL